MKRTACVLLSLMSFASPAQAVTGAELLQLNANEGTYYVWGLLEGNILVDDGNDPSISAYHLKCITESRIQSDTMYDAVTSVIKNDPKLLGQQAIGAVLKTIIEICGLPNDPAR